MCAFPSQNLPHPRTLRRSFRVGWVHLLVGRLVGSVIGSTRRQALEKELVFDPDSVSQESTGHRRFEPPTGWRYCPFGCLRGMDYHDPHFRPAGHSSLLYGPQGLEAYR